MKKTAIAVIADGTEEVECLAVVDVLRRAGFDTPIVSADGETVTGSHGIKITADAMTADVKTAPDLIFIPGGKAGAERLANCAPLIDMIAATLARGGRVAAICAAPALVLGAHGFLNGKRATCYPGFEPYMSGAAVCAERVVTDGQITTAKAMGCSVELGIELVRLLAGEEQAEIVQKSIFC